MTAMPSEPPIVRRSVVVPVAAPMSRGSALLIVMSRVLWIRKPMPAPSTNVSADGTAVGVSAPTVRSARPPTAVNAPPTMVYAR